MSDDEPITTAAILRALIQGASEARTKPREKGDLFGAFSKVLDSYQKLAPEHSRQFNEAANPLLAPFGMKLPVNEQRILVVAPTTVMYQFKSAPLSSAVADAITAVEKRITEILAANPTADLYRYEDALGITILDVQWKIERPTKKGFNG